VSAGSFLAIATSNLLPQIHREGVRRGRSLAFLLVGIAVVVGSGLAVGH
jgi:zinc transporter ZupT